MNIWPYEGYLLINVLIMEVTLIDNESKKITNKIVESTNLLEDIFTFFFLHYYITTITLKSQLKYARYCIFIFNITTSCIFLEIIFGNTLTLDPPYAILKMKKKPNLFRKSGWVRWKCKLNQSFWTSTIIDECKTLLKVKSTSHVRWDCTFRGVSHTSFRKRIKKCESFLWKDA